MLVVSDVFMVHYVQENWDFILKKYHESNQVLLRFFFYPVRDQIMEVKLSLKIAFLLGGYLDGGNDPQGTHPY